MAENAELGLTWLRICATRLRQQSF